MKGTIFEKSTTSLQLWFYAIYLMASTRCGISAKQMERELGVTYKTAWRMFNRIRSLMAEDPGKLSGDTSEVQSNIIECWSMPWWGFKKGPVAMMVIVETPDDAAYQFNHPAGGPTMNVR